MDRNVDADAKQARDAATRMVIDELKVLYKQKLLPVEQTFMWVTSFLTFKRNSPEFSCLKLISRFILNEIISPKISIHGSNRFNRFYSPLMTDSEFESKPMVLLIGQYSTGKTTVRILNKEKNKRRKVFILLSRGLSSKHEPTAASHFPKEKKRVAEIGRKKRRRKEGKKKPKHLFTLITQTIPVLLSSFAICSDGTSLGSESDQSRPRTVSWPCSMETRIVSAPLLSRSFFST